MDVIPEPEEDRFPKPNVIKSQKGKHVLHFKGYIYQIHSTSRDDMTRYWRCNKRDIITNNDNSNIVFKKDGTDMHLHGPSRAEAAVRKVISGIKERAQMNPNEVPSRILRAELSNLNNDEVLVQLPERNLIRRTINRAQNRTRPVNPASLADLIIAHPYDVTLNNARFLMFDSGNNVENRTILFGTDENLRYLSQCRTMFCDGTFKTSPTHFMQLFTIHGHFRGHAFPFVYCLTEQKNQETYRSIYSNLKNFAADMGVVMHPAMIKMDFELADMNAAREEFPGTTVSGCLFHFTQSIWRNVVKFGLRQAYLDEDVVKNQICELMALPFVPIENIVQVFDNLLEEQDVRIEDLASYIDRTYIRGRGARGRRAATPARFPPPVWNVYNSVLNGEQRTTNAVEGWHNKFQRMIVVHHASVWKVLENIKEEQRDTEVQITKLLAGHENVRQPLSKKYKTNQRQVEEMVRNYQKYKEDNDTKRYLRNISYRLKINPGAIDLNV